MIERRCCGHAYNRRGLFAGYLAHLNQPFNILRRNFGVPMSDMAVPSSAEVILNCAPGRRSMRQENLDGAAPTPPKFGIALKGEVCTSKPVDQSNNNTTIGVMSTPFSGVRNIAADGVLLPPPLLATTEHEYTTPPVRPKTVIGEPAPVPVRMACRHQTGIFTVGDGQSSSP